MGYYSEVRCIIYGAKVEMQAFITAQALVFSSPVFREFKGSLSLYATLVGTSDDLTELCVLDLYGDYWKWYKGNEDVKAWTAFMNEAEEAGLDYEFVRIGEDEGDIERSSTENTKCLLYVSTPTIQDDINKGEDLPLMF
jgi:hypothetical protein